MWVALSSCDPSSGNPPAPSASARADAPPSGAGAVSSSVRPSFRGSSAWKRWLDNLRAFPLDADSALVRAYLDQGKRHPRQLAGQHSASFLLLVKPWLECEEMLPSSSYIATVSREGCGFLQP